MRGPEQQATDGAEAAAILARGSKSFSAASLLLPASTRADAAALYAFCRVADDAVDGQDEAGRGGEGGGLAAVDRLRRRLDGIYAGTPEDDPVDRAFSATVLRVGIPRAIPDALLEGFAWDAAGRSYTSLSEVRGYGVRVAGTVGLMMCLIMGRREPRVLARAVELGVAMQLTNIARDVGEDARNGRVYLPSDLLQAAGMAPSALLARPLPCPALASVVSQLLAEAARLYSLADQGIPWLPARCRPAIRAARLIYADIGRVIAARGHDSVSDRASTSRARKLALALRALGVLLWRPRPLPDPPLEEAEALILAVLATPAPRALAAIP